MKTFLLSLIILFCFQLNAQYFPPNQSYLTISHSGVDPWYSDSKYTLKLDSIFNDTQFYSVQGNSIKYYNGKVWGPKDPLFKKDEIILYYDFNAEIGDTIVIAVPGMHYVIDTLVVDSIKYLYYGKHFLKTQYVHPIRRSDLRDAVFVDSMGSLINGLFFNQSYEFEHGSTLLNVCRDSHLLYYNDHPVVKNGKYTCFPIYHNSIDYLLLQKGFTLYPNPASNSFHIELVNSTNASFKLYNTFGQILLKQELYTSNTDIILDDIPVGLYTIELIIDGVRKLEQLCVVR